MKRKIVAVVLFCIATLTVFGQGTQGSKPLTKTSFQMAFFTKNVDSLRRERFIIDSISRVDRKLLDTLRLELNKIDATVDHCITNNMECSDQLNELIAKFEKKLQKSNAVVEKLDAHNHYFKQLFPRITNRLQAFAKNTSTDSKTILIDWSTYIDVHQEFAGWFNQMITESNSRSLEMNAILGQLSAKIKTINGE